MCRRLTANSDCTPLFPVPRLMHVADEVDEKLQGFDSASREALLSQRMVSNDSMRSITQLWWSVAEALCL